MALSHWATAAAREAYWRAYDDSLSLWPMPSTSSFVDTPQGRTHVLTSGSSAGTPVILLHAASLSAVQWYPQVAELGAHHPLFAIDVMGDIGRSTQTGPMRSRIEAAQWLCAVMDGIGISSAIVIGSSFGGFLSANLAVHAPERVAALVLLGPAATLQPFTVLSSLLIRLGSLLPLPSTVRPGLRAMMGGALPDERIVRQMELGVASFRYDRDGIFPRELPDDELRCIRSPTLVLIGEHERIYQAPDAAARARALIQRATVEVMPGLGHLPGLQDPHAVNARISEFLGKHAGGTPRA